MPIKAIASFLRKEPVLCASALLAALSVLVVPPSVAYADYIDLRVLCLLFCLMAVVAGFQDCGVFDLLAQRLLSGKKPFRAVCILLVLLPFFTAMLVTNDVSLIAFVPFAIFVLRRLGRESDLIRVIVSRPSPPIWAAWPRRWAIPKTSISMPITSCLSAASSLCSCL